MPRVMSALPRSGDSRKLCNAGQTFSGTLPVARLSRLAEIAEDDTTTIQYRLEFLRDHRHRCMVLSSVSGQVSVECQRCLEPVAVEVSAETQSQIVWTQEQVDAAEYETVFVEDENLDLLALVEDDVLLTMPLIPKHKQCEPPIFESADVEDADLGEAKPNPFAVLASLKGKD